MENFKNSKINSIENESDETEISNEDLEAIKETDPDLYYAIMDKMIIKSESEINKILNDPELAKQKEIEDKKIKEEELRKVLDGLYTKDPNDKYTDI